MTIAIGTDACLPGTVSGEIFAGFETLYGEETADSDAVRGVAFAIAQGVIEGMRTQIADGEAIVRSGSTLAGGAGGGGGGAPSDAQYLVAASNGTLSAERVATNTTTVEWDFATAGQAKATVPDATTTTKGAVELATSAETTAGLAVQASDTRLSDARVPTSHATSHQNGGADEVSVTGLSGLLADAQTPLSHATSHQSGGGDAIKLDDLAAPDDTTDLDSSTSRHGLLAKLSNFDGEFMSGVGTWLIPQEHPKTVYELDWSGLGSQLGLGDGNVAVSGVNWTAANTANASLFQILNGSGLQITAASGVSRTWTGALTTSPALYVSLDSLAAAIAKYPLTLTIWSYFSAWSTPSSSNSIIAGCYAPAGASYTAVVSGVGFNNTGAGSFPMMQRTATFTAATPLSSSYDVVVWRFLPRGTVDAWCGVWSAGWPTALTPIGNDVQPSASTIVTTNQIRRAGATILYSPATRSASGAPSFTLARTRIQIG